MRRIEEIYWTPDVLAKVEERGITMDDVGEALDFAFHESVSRSSGRPIRFGIVDGREIAVVFEWVEGNAVLVVTAFERG
jgi:hypothetical protein